VLSQAIELIVIQFKFFKSLKNGKVIHLLELHTTKLPGNNCLENCTLFAGFFVGPTAMFVFKCITLIRGTHALPKECPRVGPTYVEQQRFMLIPRFCIDGVNESQRVDAETESVPIPIPTAIPIPMPIPIPIPSHIESKLLNRS